MTSNAVPVYLLRDLVIEGRAELQTGPFGTQLHASAYIPDGIPVVAVRNIGDNKIVADGIPMISLADANRLNRYRLLPGDILFGRKGAVDRRALIAPGQKGWLQGSDCIRLRFDKTIDSRYVSYVLGTSAMRRWLVQNAHGATMPSLNQRILGLLPLPLPPLPEQRRIAHILGTLDDKIELNRQMNQTLDEIARTLFRSWFVDFDPVRAKAEGRQPDGMDAETAALFPTRLVNSELGPIPKGWEWSTVGDEFAVTMGQSPPGSTYNQLGDGMPFYQGRADFGFRFPSERVFCTAPTRFASAGDALISVRAPVGDANVALRHCAIGRGVAALRHRSGSDSFTFHSVVGLQPQLATYNSEGTVFGSINQKSLRSLRVVRSSAAVVNLFELMVGPMDGLVRSNAEENQMLAGLRDTLLPEMLSGRLSA